MLSEHCPACAHRLAGLPLRGRCPGCGFPFEPDMSLWPRRHRQPLLALGLAYVFVAAGGIIATYGWQIGERRAIYSGAGFAMLFLWYASFIRWRESQSLAIGRERLVIGGRGQESYEELALADLVLAHHGQELLALPGHRPISYYVPRLRTSKRERACIQRLLLHRWRRALAARRPGGSAQETGDEIAGPRAAPTEKGQ